MIHRKTDLIETHPVKALANKLIRIFATSNKFFAIIAKTLIKIFN